MTNFPKPIEPSADLNYHGGGLFDWVEGMPRPKRTRSMGKEQIQAVHNAAAALPYKGVWNPLTQTFEIEPDYENMTQAEVAILKMWQKAAEGDSRVYEKLMDRMLGKPKQAVETVSMKLSYQEVLDMLAQQDRQEGYSIDIDCSPVDESTPQNHRYVPGSIFDDPSVSGNSQDLDDLDDLLEGV